MLVQAMLFNPSDAVENRKNQLLSEQFSQILIFKMCQLRKKGSH